MAGSVYTYTANASGSGDGAITTSQGIVRLGQSGLFTSSEYLGSVASGCVLVAGPATSPASQLVAPTVVAGSAGNPNGVYRYAVTFVTAAGETTIGPEALVTLASLKGSISGIPLGNATSGVLERKIYRTVAGGGPGNERLLATLSDNTTTTFLDNIADGSLGAAAPISDTSGVPGGTGQAPTAVSEFALLTGNTADDTEAISAGTGKKISVGGGGDAITKAAIIDTGLAASDIGADAAGAAATAQSAAEAASDPSGSAAAAQAAAEAASDSAGTSAAETTRAQGAEALLAPKASPALTGTPTAPTAAANDNSTKLATTAYADRAAGTAITTAEAASDAAGTAVADVATEATARAAADALKAPLASPALTGNPTVPTQTALDSSTKAASTAYADSAVGVETTRAQGIETIKGPKGLVVTPEQSGAKGDGAIFTDGAIQSGQNTLTTTAAGTAAASAIRAGNPVYVMGAGTHTVLGALSSTLSTGSPITSLPVTALGGAIPAGIIVLNSGAHSQVFQNNAVSGGATAIPIASATPNFAYPSTTSVLSYGNALSTTISSVAGNVITLAANASTTVNGTSGWFGTDDTAAIQAAIDTIVATGTLAGGRVLFDGKNYIVATAPRTDRSGNSQLALGGVGGSEGPSVFLEGVHGVTSLCSTYISGTYSGAHGPPSMLGGQTVEGGAIGFFYSPPMRVEGINANLPENPTLGAFDFSGCVESIVRHSSINTPIGASGGGYGTAGRQPSNTWAFGLLTPLADSGTNRVEDCQVQGFYLGMCGGDHLMLDHTELESNYIGLGFYDGHCGGYPTNVLYLDMFGFVYGIAGWVPASGVRSLTASNPAWLRGYISFEDWGSWSAPTNHVLDANNQLIGKLETHSQTFSGPRNAPFTDISGAQNLRISPIDPRGESAVVTFGNPTFIQVFTSNGTWTKPPGVNVVDVYCIGGGCGGASGPTTASGTACAGGMSGGTGGYSEGRFVASDLTSTVSVTVAGVTTGGAGVSTNSNAGNTVKTGANSSFGSYLQAQGGSGSSSAGIGTTQSGLAGIAGSSGAAGASGSGAFAGTGGPGGGISTAPAFKAGGTGGTANGNLLAGGNGGGTDGAAGTNGTANAATNSPLGGSGGGGGASSVSTTGGAGKNGGGYGSGGGGGGAALNGHTSGAGGSSGAGFVVVISR